MITRKKALEFIKLTENPCTTLKEVKKRIEDNFKLGFSNAIVDIDNSKGLADKVILKLRKQDFDIFPDKNGNVVVLHLEIR